MRRSLRCEDLRRLRVNDEMQLALGSPVASISRRSSTAVSFQASAINEDVDGAISEARLGHVCRQSRGAARHCGVIGYLNVEL